MAEREIALDASALLALCYEEPGSHVVRKALSKSVIGAVNLAEVLGKLGELGWTEKEKDTVMALPFKVEPFDSQTARITGELIRLHRRKGLSLADCACLTLGLRYNYRVMTSDQAWAKIQARHKLIVIR
jgi:PIN domain nuclease of toxin-antitoxin system